ncbi:MAG: bile acid:sodium symporter family protein [Pirellulaceae bacterium]|nr:bile acid:sodium symporter family protein [Pirellulaceae bacterium]
MLQRGLLIWLCGLSLLAFYWTAWFPGWFDPFVASRPLLSWLIVLTMFAIGWMLPRDEIAQVARRWPSVLAGTALQYATMPLLAYLAARWFGFTGPHLVGVVMVGCVPGAMASNVLTLNARGNTSYSVSLTTTATLLSPLAVPLALGLCLGLNKQLNASLLLATGWQLVWMVVLPVGGGHLLARLWPASRAWSARVGSIVANLAILWIIAAVVGRGRQELEQADLVLVAALLLINLGGYLAGYLGGWGLRLPESMRRALTLEIGMQNAGLGATLASQLFPDEPATAIAPALYTFGCMLTGTLLAAVWSRGRPPEGS